jgi:hypothetical protein
MKFTALFTAVDSFSGTLASLGAGLDNFTRKVGRGGTAMHEYGQRLSELGERMGITSAILSEGADQLSEWSDKVVEPAASMQQALAGFQAETAATAGEMARLHEEAVRFSETHPGATAAEWMRGLTQFREVYQDTNRAIAGEETAAKLTKLGFDQASAVAILAGSYTNLKVDAQAAGDQLIAMKDVFGLSNPSQLAMGMGRLGGAFQATHTSIAEAYALFGQAGQMMPGRGMQAFASALDQLYRASTEGKNNIDFNHGMLAGLQQVAHEIAGMSGAAATARLKDMGIGNGDFLLPFLGHLDKIAAGEHKIAAAAGQLDRQYQVATNNAVDQTQLLHQNLDNLYDAMGSSALGFVNGWLATITGTVRGLTSATEHHTTIARVATESLLVLGYGASTGVHAMASLGTTIFFAGESIKLLSGFIDLEALALRGLYAWEYAVAAGAKVWAAAQWLLNAALAPEVLIIGGIVLAAAALALVAYEVYEHWGAISAFFKKLWADIKSIFSGMVDWLKTAGLTMMRVFGDGILAGIEYPFRAVTRLADKIASVIKFHSPPDAGPLHDIDRVTLTDVVAQGIRPDPVMRAVNRVATAMMPMGGGIALAGAAAGGAGIVINAPLTINGSGLDEAAILRVIRRHAREIYEAFMREQKNRSRTELK